MNTLFKITVIVTYESTMRSVKISMPECYAVADSQGKAFTKVAEWIEKKFSKDMHIVLSDCRAEVISKDKDYIEIQTRLFL